MPYISKHDRSYFDSIDDLPLGGEGTLNYALTRVCLSYLERSGVDYKSINDVVGALECAKLEFYRRLAAHYEDDKAAQNGDVY